MKKGFAQIGLGGILVLSAPYAPHLGGRNSRSYNRYEPYDYDLFSPTTMQLMGKTLCLHGLREFLAAVNEKYNILVDLEILKAQPLTP